MEEKMGYEMEMAKKEIKKREEKKKREESTCCIEIISLFLFSMIRCCILNLNSYNYF